VFLILVQPTPIVAVALSLAASPARLDTNSTLTAQPALWYAEMALKDLSKIAMMATN